MKDLGRRNPKVILFTSQHFPPNSHSFTFFVSVCCIYHKPRRFDESSDESSDSDSDSSSSCPHEHDHNHNHRPNRSRRGSSSSNSQQPQRTRGVVHEPELLDDAEPNAYEQQPELKKGKRKASALSCPVHSEFPSLTADDYFLA